MREKVLVIDYHIRISPEEKAKLVQLAEQAGKNTSEFIRDFINQAAERTQISGRDQRATA